MGRAGAGDDFTTTKRLVEEDYENHLMAEQERDDFDEPDEAPDEVPDEPPPSADPAGLYPVPGVVWQGLYAEIADYLGDHSWEVLLGCLTATGAHAHRKIDAKYHGRLFGMFYGLLVAPSGSGKSICTETCRGLLPDWYTVRGAVQSGPALAPVLAIIERDKKGRIESIEPRPAILIIEEWSRLGKNLKMSNSTLSEDLNTLADGPRLWNVSRSEASKQGGGDTVIMDPCLTICGTTTEGRFGEVVTVTDLRNGTINRYMTLPGAGTEWLLHDPDRASMDFYGLSAFAQRFPETHTLGQNFESVWDIYEPDALEAFLAWGTPKFERNPTTFEAGIMNNKDQSAEAEAIKRLHAQAHRTCLLYAWKDGADRIKMEHFEAAQAIIDTSHAFLMDLLSRPGETPAPQGQQYDLDNREQVRSRLGRMWEAKPGTVRMRKVFEGLRRQMTYKAMKAILSDLQDEGYCRVNGKEVEQR